ncbi:hypothetical protein D3C77_577590 [compost metagenome]
MLLHLLERCRARPGSQLFTEPEIIVLQGQLAPAGRREKVHRTVPADIDKPWGRQQVQRSRKVGDDFQDLRQVVLKVHPGQHTNGVGLPQQCFHHGVGTLVGGAQHDHQPIGLGYQVFP